MQILDEHLILSASDLVGHLACGHLTVLEREAAETGKRQPVRLDPALDVLAKRGREREEKFLDEARAAGRRIVEFPGEPVGGLEALREARRPRSSSTRWPPRRPRTRPGTSTSCTRGTG